MYIKRQVVHLTFNTIIYQLYIIYLQIAEHILPKEDVDHIHHVWMQMWNMYKVYCHQAEYTGGIVMVIVTNVNKVTKMAWAVIGKK
jgi:hypothetical protein